MRGAAQLLIRFFRLLDERDYVGLARLMTTDGVWSRQGKELSGEAMIVGTLSERSPTLRIHHLLTNVFAEPSGDGMSVTAYMLVLRHDDGKPSEGPAPLSGIENARTLRALLRETRDGWRIERLLSDPISFARLS